MKNIRKAGTFTVLLMAVMMLVACKDQIEPPVTDTNTTNGQQTTTFHEHIWKEQRVEPTCQENGYIWRYCEKCDETYNETLPATGHKLVSLGEIDPTCTDQGYTVQQCTVCKYVEKTDFVPAKGHTYEEQVIPPTYYEQGYTEHICRDCRDSYRDNFTPMLSSSVIARFDPAGGTLNGYPIAYYNTNEQATLPEASRTGYTFLGWFDEDGNLYESGIWSHPNDVDLHAEWQPLSFSLTLDANGGEVKFPPLTVSYGNAYGYLPEPEERFGYLFLGWFKGDEQITGDMIFEELTDVTLVARWNAPTGSGSCGEDLTWTACGDGITRITGTGTTIAAGAFTGTNVVKVIIPDTVTKVESGAFRDCLTLEEVTISGSVEVIRSETFAGCTNLKKVTVKRGISAVNMQAFEGCTSLSEITLPETVLQMYDPFGGCSALKDIYYKGSAFKWSCIVKDASLEAFLANGVTVHCEE